MSADLKLTAVMRLVVPEFTINIIVVVVIIII